MVIENKIEALIKRVRRGEVSALARSITLLEEGQIDITSIVPLLEAGKKSFKIGFTGPPGAGKSSIIDWIIKHIRAKGEKVGIIATDPSSPFTGGAILGDRIRMQHHFLDAGVFIRSLGSRGAHGGISKITSDASMLLELAGYRFIILETVGVGQTELDIMNIADTVVVVLVPEAGDVVQAMKAGIMEIANIFVINKSDHTGAKEMMNALKFIIETSGTTKETWDTAIILTNGLDGTGINELLDAILRHKEYMEKYIKPELIFKKRIRGLQQIAVGHIVQNIEEAIAGLSSDYYVNSLKDPSISLYTILNRLLKDKSFLKKLK